MLPSEFLRKINQAECGESDRLERELVDLCRVAVKRHIHYLPKHINLLNPKDDAEAVACLMAGAIVDIVTADNSVVVHEIAEYLMDAAKFIIKRYRSSDWFWDSVAIRRGQRSRFKPMYETTMAATDSPNLG